MTHLIVIASKYLMIFMYILYSLECFLQLKSSDNPARMKRKIRFQRKLILLFLLDGFFVLYVTSGEIKILILALIVLAIIGAIFIIYNIFYKNASGLLINNMAMLFSTGIIMLTRIDYDKAIRQLFFFAVGGGIIFIIPVILSHLSLFRKLTGLYAVLGIALLLLVLAAGSVSFGAKLSITVAGIAIQPSEFVKILFVFFVGSMLYEDSSFSNVIKTSLVAAVFVLILVASKDLGSALLYFFTCLIILYVASGRFFYLFAGLLSMSAAAIAGAKMFSHVATRVLAWKDPLSVIDNEGYQVCQSLFAIGTGGWFGLGLNQGIPKKIPVVENDFIFSAISEEMGGITAVCLIMICLSCIFVILNIAMQLKDDFYRLVALGLATIYAMQVFLMIGGGIKFIPSTGVTLPLVSYGGSSLLSTMIIIGIIEGLYLRKDKDMNKIDRTGDWDEKGKEKGYK